MTRNTSPTLVRVFIAVVVACVLVLAGFGAGATVGLWWSRSSASERIPGDAGSSPEPHAANSTALPVPSPSPSGTPPSAEGSESGSLNTELFGEAWQILQDQFYGELPAGPQITYDAIRGVVDRLGDPHTAFVDPKEAAILQADLDGQFEGIGARVDLAEQGGVEIKYMFANQPAEKAGLLVGDVILAVNGKDVTKLGLTEAITLIRGPRGSTVLLRVPSSS
jgi:C-terminal processing protease CtpA/Prc